MAKVGVSFRIDVTKLDKARFFKGAKGTYLDVTGFIELEQEDEYGNSGFITQNCSKEEREGGLKMPILGNSKIFFRDGVQQSAAPQAPQQYQQPAPQQQAYQQAPAAPAFNNFDDDDGIPF